MCGMEWQLLTVCLLLPASVILQSTSAEGSNVREDLWPKLSVNYSKKFLPPQDGPVIVELDLYILSLSAISEKTMDFKVNMFLRQRWRDTRLVNNASHDLRLTSAIDELWVPDLYLANDKVSERADVTVDNAFLNADNQGNIVYSQRITSTIACAMDLKLYPFDIQRCSIKFESYGHTTDELVFRWKSSGKAIEVNDKIALPEHEIANKNNVTRSNCTVSYSTTGAFSCIAITFRFDRTVNYYVMSVFIPSVLIVVLSWVSFWIDKESTPGRISLALLTILTMQTQLGANMAQLPRVSYIKFIDVWLTGCLGFVFAGFLEYALVNKLSTEEKKQKALAAERGPTEVIALMKKYMMPEAMKMNGTTSEGEELMMTENPSDKKRLSVAVSEPEKSGRINCIGWADRVDHFSRFLFPGAFLVCNIILWITLYVQKEKQSSV